MFASTLLKDVKIDGRFLLDLRNVTLVGLGIASIIALVLACRITRTTLAQAVREARRLIDAIGWAVLLPHKLAVLGNIALLYFDGELRVSAGQSRTDQRSNLF